MLPPLISSTGLLLAMLLVSAALGRRLLRALGDEAASRLDQGLLAAGLGLGALQAVPFVLLSIGLGHAAWFRGVMLVLALVLLPDIAAVLRALALALRAFGRRSGPYRRLAVPFALLLLAVYLRALCPVTDDDGLSYHFSAACRWLAAGRFVFLPTLTYTNWPSSVELLIVLLRGLVPDAPAGLVQFLMGTIAFLAACRCAAHLGGRRAAAMTAVLMLTYKVYWEEMAQAHVDLAVSAGATLALLALLTDTSPETAPRRRRLAAIFAGLAATAKLNGLAVAGVLALLVAALPARERPSLREAARRAALFLGTVLAILAPWAVKTWCLTGNPVYPLLYPVFGGCEWTGDGWPRVQRYFLLLFSLPGLPPTLPNLLLARGLLVVACGALALFVFRRTSPAAADVPARLAALGTLAIFATSGYNLRFLLPLFPAAAIALGMAWARRRVPTAVVGPVCLALALRIGISGPAPGLLTATSYALGRLPAQTYLAASLPDYPTVEYANRVLPADGRVLVATWEEATAYYRPLALRANYWLQDSLHYDSLARLTADLRRLRVGYLVLAPVDAGWCSRSYVCAERARTEMALLDQVAHRYGVRLFERNGVSLFRLNLLPDW